MTADCWSSSTSCTIKTCYSFKLFFFISERKLYTYLIPLVQKKKNICVPEVKQVPEVPESPWSADL